jgi:hypothetical protein
VTLWGNAIVVESLPFKAEGPQLSLETSLFMLSTAQKLYDSDIHLHRAQSLVIEDRYIATTEFWWHAKMSTLHTPHQKTSNFNITRLPNHFLHASYAFCFYHCIFSLSSTGRMCLVANSRRSRLRCRLLPTYTASASSRSTTSSTHAAHDWPSKVEIKLQVPSSSRCQ